MTDNKPTPKRDPNDPKTWGGRCGIGFIGNARFGTGQVIERTNRATTRKWRREQEPKRRAPDEPI